MRTRELAHRIEDFLQAHAAGYNYRDLAREIKERPTSVDDALKNVCKVEGKVVFDPFVGGWCHVDHHYELRRDKERLAAFRKLSTTRSEDFLSVGTELLLRALNETELGSLLREETGKDMEVVAEIILNEGEEGEEIREEIAALLEGWEGLEGLEPLEDRQDPVEDARQAYRIVQRWRLKPEA